MLDQLIGASERRVPSSTFLLRRGGSSFSTRTSSLREVMKWSTSNISSNLLFCQQSFTMLRSLELTKGKIRNKRERNTWNYGRPKHLASAQKDVLSSSGTIRVIFKYLAIATMSQICKGVSWYKLKLRCLAWNVTNLLIYEQYSQQLAFGWAHHCMKPLDTHYFYILLQETELD